ncbi:MAG: outer membrane lipoprotein carrier protein LolA [Deltaproteobacteria bacterium]|nr:outer membrane lipoprotein carrier protein LolA [Deltaproteobacteria bacterium]
MKRLFFIVLLFCVCLLQPAAGQADALTPLEIAQRIQETYEKTTSFKADFLQTSSVSDMERRQRRGSGTMVIQKPSLLRWDYVSPDKQVLVSDGKNFSLYFAAENQMIVTPAKEYLQEDVTYNFFSGKGNLLQDFEVSALPGEQPKQGTLAIMLVPKKTHAQVATLNVWVDEGTFLVSRLEIHDHLGSITNLMLFNTGVNKPVPADYFHFTPPAGTEIIEQ